MKYLSTLVFLACFLLYFTPPINGKFFSKKINTTNFRTSGNGKPSSYSLIRCSSKEGNADCDKNAAASPEEMRAEDMETLRLKCEKPIVDGDYIDHHVNCYALGNIVKKIDYNVVRNHEQKVMPIASACLRCGVCVAVAKQLNTTLLEAQQNAYLPRKESYATKNYRRTGYEELDPDLVTSLLRSRCCYGFENYGLREYAGERSITEAHSYTDHVPSAHDGQWPEKLREICNSYLDDYGEESLYRDWLAGHKKGNPDVLVNLLCRSHGLFRDCSNMNFHVNSTDNSMSTITSPCWRLM